MLGCAAEGRRQAPLLPLYTLSSLRGGRRPKILAAIWSRDSPNQISFVRLVLFCPLRNGLWPLVTPGPTGGRKARDGPGSLWVIINK